MGVALKMHMAGELGRHALKLEEWIISECLGSLGPTEIAHIKGSNAEAMSRAAIQSMNHISARSRPFDKRKF